MEPLSRSVNCPKLAHLSKLKDSRGRGQHHTLKQVHKGQDRHHNHVNFLDNLAFFPLVYPLEDRSGIMFKLWVFVCDRARFGLRNTLNMGFL